MTYVSQALDETHITRSFDCGKPDLNTWLKDHALTTEARRTGRSFIWQQNRQVCAYYTIAAHLIVRDDLPKVLGRGNPGQIPTVLLARLALDKTLHGKGLGGALLADALARIVVATQTVAARFVVVDAIDEGAAEFYAHHGFRRVPETRRLVAKISDIAASLSDA